MGALTRRKMVTALAVTLAGAAGGLAVGVHTSSAQAAPGPQLAPWTATTSLPAPRSRSGVVHGNGFMYLIGGQDGSTNVSTSYVAPVLPNGTVGAWTTTTPLPGPRRTVRPAFANGYVYVAGGNDGFAFRNEVYVARANADGTLGAWQSTTPLPVGSTSHSTLATGGYLYVVGGNIGSTCVSTVRFARINADGTLGAWSTTSALPTPRCGNVETVTVANGRMYAVGGYNNSDVSNEVAYATINPDGSLGAWTVNPNRIAVAREYNGVEAMNGYLYVLGGQPVLVGGATSSVEVAAIAADGSVGPFMPTASLPGPRGELSTEAVGGYLFVFGGGTGLSGTNPQANVWSTTALPADVTPPTVSITAPAAGATVSGTVSVTANAGDNMGVAGVQFVVDGTPTGAEDTTAPYALSWNTTAAANGNHTLTAVARDTSGNTTTSAAVTVNVLNAAPPVGGLAIAYGLDEGAGTTTNDASATNNDGTLVNAAWNATGRYGTAAQLNGTNALVRSSAPVSLGTTFTLEAWVLNPANNGYETILTVGSSRDLYLANGQLAFTSGGGAFGAVPTGSWQHVAVTYDGTTLRAYLNGNPLGTARTVSYGAVNATLQVGGWPSGSNSYDFLSGSIDEVRVYTRALSQAEIAADLATPITPPPVDTTPPVVTNPQPAGVLPVGTTSAELSVTTNEAATCRYGTTPGVSYGSQPTAFTSTGGTTHTATLSGLTGGTAYTFYVRCQDAALNATTDDAVVSFSVAAPDTTGPSVSVTAPAAGSTLAGTVNVTADAVDDTGVAGVQFLVDGTPAGPEDTTAPFTYSWDTTAAANGSHTLTATARDAAGNTTTSAGVTVEVSNTPPPVGGPVLAYGLNENTGTATNDASPSNNDGTLVNATWNASGRYGAAAELNGTNALVRADAPVALGAAFTIEAWVLNPGNGPYETVVTVGSNRDLYLVNGTLTFWTGAADVTFGAVPAGAWQHVALTYDGTTLRAYLNGAPLGNPQDVSLAPVTATLQIGAWAAGGGAQYDLFSGSIDELRVYDRALSAAEIATDLATPIGG